MKFLTKKLRSRIFIFASSALIAAVLLVTFQMVIYAAKMDAGDRHLDRINTIRQAEWNTINIIIKDSIEKATRKLDEQIIPEILSDIKEEYGNDNDRLKYDLENLVLTEHDNPLVHILASNIEGRYMYGIQSDSNDIFIMTKQDGIITDPSISSSSPDRPRTLEEEIQAHYNPHLAQQAFSSIINQSRRINNPVIFWQFNEPSYIEEEKITSMKLSELQNLLEKNSGDLSILESYEFLVPRYIFFDRDLLGNKLVDDRGTQNNIYQLIVVQGFNIVEIVQNNGVLDSIYSGINTQQQSDLSEFIHMTRIQQILMFAGLFTVTVWSQFSIKARQRYIDRDPEIDTTP